MSKVKIETITPVHIGSGEFLRYGTDFIEETEKKQSYLYVVDEHKILDLIGPQHINDWVAGIERGKEIRDLIKRYNPSKSFPEHYAKRRIENYAEIQKNMTLKECIHDGRGIPYIPGSSIKGAIRTALLSALLERKDTQWILNLLGKPFASSISIENALFANPSDQRLQPQKDIFRFLRVGDAYFPSCSETSLTMINLNIRKGYDSLIDKSKSQVIEAIDSKKESEFTITLDLRDYDFIKNKGKEQIGTLPEEMKTLSSLFHAVNKHTKQLLESEIKCWERLEAEKEGAQDYIDTLKDDILDRVNIADDEYSCILRIGHGSGWRFITGAWSERLGSYFTNTVVRNARFHSERYTEYDFPKSRRIYKDGFPLGFVKLTLI